MDKTENLKLSELNGCTVRITDGKMTFHRTEQFTDGHLLNAFQEGDPDAIRSLCARLATDLRQDGIRDKEVSAALADIFERIGNGEAPNAAFRYSKPRGGQSKNTAFRDWYVKRAVQERMCEHEESVTKASRAVSSESGGDILLSAKMIGNICAGLTKDDPLPVPDDIFPLGDTRQLPKPRKLNIDSTR